MNTKYHTLVICITLLNLFTTADNGTITLNLDNYNLGNEFLYV